MAVRVFEPENSKIADEKAMIQAFRFKQAHPRSRTGAA
jgi:hypothetical protein